MDHIVQWLQTRGHTLDVDTIDRIRYLHLPRALSAIAIFLFTNSYVGEPVQCWLPKQFTGPWEQYVETYCLIEGSYYVNINSTNLPEAAARKKIIYYQWIPFIVVAIAAALYVPRVLWRIYQKRSGLDVSSIAIDLRKRAKLLEPTKIHIDSSRFFSNLWGSILFHKILSLILIVILLFMLEHFFGVGWAIEQTSNLFRGREWHESAQFPRVTYCDAEVREMGGQVHTWTVQCVLMVNMFNEKIFFVIWWSLIIVFVLSALNIIDWIVFLMSASEQKRIIMALVDHDRKTSKSMEDAFVNHVMRKSGASFVRLLSFSVSHFEVSSHTGYPDSRGTCLMICFDRWKTSSVRYGKITSLLE
ncbi:hypothetical protein PFISCL1PPCAC_20198 [Pristionchus fissidentatus]|uniref:Innexin n=1 Tax=Pristionchus fissidentatus TaxID=1538716 RepID=A0AAV5WAH7_9BILA|nr:hypothetical protein PFISCL1PPCAC_20198 [Pristionchus fissidentatus]